MAELPKYFYFVPKVDGLTITVEDRSDRDVVEVVRCKDCRWWDADPRYDGCSYWSADPYEYPLTHGDDYCSYGERREDG